MKILFINSVYGIGSTGSIISNLIDEAKTRNYDCFVTYGLNDALPTNSVIPYKICNKAEYIISNILSKITGLTGCFNYLSTLRFIRYYKKVKPDIVHIHNLHGYYINAFWLLRFLKKEKVRTVWTLHDCWGFTGNCAHYSYIGCKKWMSCCHHCPQIKSYPKSYLFDFTKYMFNKKQKVLSGFEHLIITTPSNWLRDQVQKSLLYHYSCVAIHNGVNTDVFSIRKSEYFCNSVKLQNKKIVLGVANAWGKKKGLDDFFLIANLLPNEYQVVLVGLNNEQLQNLPDNILGISRTNSVSELVEIYNAAYVFVNPSYEETFGLVTIEALLCGVPVITYDQTAVPEIVNVKCGYVISAGDVNRVAHCIMNLGSFNRNELRNEALVYNKKNMVDSYMRVYEELLN